MRAHWHAIHANLVQQSNRLSFHSLFRTVSQRHAALCSHRDPASVLAMLHDRQGSASAKNAVLRALIEAAQSPEPGADEAVVLLLLALWPGLDAVRERLLRHFRNDPDRLVSDLCAHATTGIRKLDLNRVTWVAATVFRNAERDIRRQLAKDWARDRERADAIDVDDLATEPDISALGLPDGIGTEEAMILLLTRLEAEIGEDASLVLRIAVAGELQHAVAASLGLTYDAVRKRYQRALAKLSRRLAG